MESMLRVLPLEQKLLLLNFILDVDHAHESTVLRGTWSPLLHPPWVSVILFLINKKTIKSVFLKSVESKLWEVRIFV